MADRTHWFFQQLVLSPPWHRSTKKRPTLRRLSRRSCLCNGPYPTGDKNQTRRCFRKERKKKKPNMWQMMNRLITPAVVNTVFRNRIRTLRTALLGRYQPGNRKLRYHFLPERIRYPAGCNCYHSGSYVRSHRSSQERNC